MTDPIALENLFRRLVAILEREGFSYAVVGALARNAWGRPRATTDADFAVALDAPAFQRFSLVVAEADLVVRKTRREDPDDEVPDLVLLAAATDPSLRIDFLIAKTPFEESAIARRRRTSVVGVDCHVVTPEDLVVYKVIAGRTRDIADIEEVVASRRSAGDLLDWEYVERWVHDFGFDERLAEIRKRA